MPALTAALVAASLRLQSLTSALLAAYLAFVGNLGLVTWALSPFRAVDRLNLAIAEALLLAAAAALWWRRGTPRIPLGGAAGTARQALRDPVTAVFLAVAAVLLGYELVLVLTVPANDWDSLTYHLSRAAAWLQHGGVYRITDAPTPRMNEYQPFAEQQILYLFAATGSGALYALPQFVAQLAILVAVYGASRRLGFGARPAVCAAILFAFLSQIALEVTQAQNDLVAASFPVVALCLLLGPGMLEPALAGVAIGMGVGAKLTIALVLPVLVVLAASRGRRVLAWSLGGALAGFAAVGAWGFAINLWNTGHVLGYLGTHIDTPAYVQPIHPSAYATSIDVLYGTFDRSVLSDDTIRWLWIAGLVAAVALIAVRRTVLPAVLVAVAFASPLLSIWGANATAWLAARWGFPVRGHFGNVGDMTRTAQGAVFGPIGGVFFLSVFFVTVVAFALRRVGWQHVVLASAVPLFYVLLGHETYNYFMTRFLLVPAALVAPLFALLLGNRIAAAAVLAIAATAMGLTITQNPLRPLDGRYGFGRPWTLTQAQAAYLTDETGVGDAVTAFQRLVPQRACVGAVLGSNEPAYFLYGPRRGHPVVYLPADNGVLQDAYARFLSYVVISNGPDRWVARIFTADGWKLHPLGSYWRLAVAPHAGDGVCKA